MSKPSWTAEQRMAIYSRGQLLVAAAAGSGKTAVLVERLLQRITDMENPIDVDRFLVVTFTKAAANEMRERIGKAIDEALFQEHDHPQLEHLLHQRALLQNANITTLHSFCLELIRKYFYQLDLDPAFRIADQAETTLLLQDVVEELFETRYDQDDLDFIQLVEAFGSDRDDLALMEHTLNIFEFSQSQPNPMTWLETLDQAYLWDNLESLMKSEWGETIRQGVLDLIAEILSLLNNAEEIALQPEGPAQYVPALQDDIDRCRLLSRVATSGTWSQIEAQVKETINFPKLSSTRSKADKQLQEDCKKLRDEAKKKLNLLQDELFSFSLEHQFSALRSMGKMAQTLGKLVLEFSQRYTEAKRKRNLLDFSDLEHYALRLLENDHQITPIAQGLREYFAEVLVDEYQDINPVQERILQLVSRQDECPNLFMVGDVKQSIYRFRMADPGLFLTKYNDLPHWSPETQGNTGGLLKIVIDLNRNFRSREEIVDGVNFLFRQIMTEGAGEISYDDQAALRYGASYVSGQDQIRTAEGPIEVHLIDLKEIKNTLEGETFSSESVKNNEHELSEMNSELSPEEFDKVRVEARFVCERIERMVKNSEFQIYDKKLNNFRPVRFSDIVILMRSYSAMAPIYVEEFQSSDIPVYAETSTGYFGASEVETMLSLLKVIDNPHLDIPLAAVLRSPLVGLNGSELGKLRMMLPEGNFYEALTLAVWAGYDGKTIPVGETERFRKILELYEDIIPKRISNAQEFLTSSQELGEKLVEFWNKLQNWRTRSRRSSLADLLWSLYEESGYLAYVGTLPAGVQRQANLRVLYDRAKRFEATRYRGLFRFLRFLERFQGQGNDMGNARALGETEDVVRLITVHASKGLEFPVVFVVGMGRTFNSQSLRGKMLLHPKLGLGMPIIDVENNVRYPSLIHYAVQRRLKQESLAEELRILYVALTRAKERLLLYGNVDGLENALHKWQRVSNTPEVTLSDGQLRSAKSFLDWVMPAIIRHPFINLGNSVKESSVPLPETHSKWEVCIHRALSSEQRTGQDIEFSQFGEASGEVNDEKGEHPDVVEPFNNESDNLSGEQWYQEIHRRLSWVYPHPVNQTAKTSVSELKRQHLWYIHDDTSQHPTIHSKAEQVIRPKFLQSFRSLTAAERGTVMHTVMQHLPFKEWSSSWPTLHESTQAAYIIQFLDQLQEREILSLEQKNTIQPLQIVRLLNSPLGIRLFSSVQILREVPFTLTFPPQKFAQENILVQGVIDVVMIFKREDEICAEILDYKTDSLGGTDKEPEEIFRDKYALQLTLYALAIERLMGISVTQTTLYSFNLDREIIIPNSLRADLQQSLENQLFL